LPIFDPKKCYNLFSHPYSPDLSPPDYFLFPKLKVKLKGLHFADVPEIQEAVTDELRNVQKVDFLVGFQKLYHRAKACIYMPVELILNKKGICIPRVCSIKKNSPKTFGPHCVMRRFAGTDCWGLPLQGNDRRGVELGGVDRTAVAIGLSVCIVTRATL
jgi:hypothetical protein